MEYAIEVLMSELHNLKAAVRTEERYSVHPEYRGGSVDFAPRIAEIQAAIKILKTATPQSDSAPLSVMEEVLNSKTNLGLEEIEEVMNTIRARKG